MKTIEPSSSVTTRRELLNKARLFLGMALAFTVISSVLCPPAPSIAQEQTFITLQNFEGSEYLDVTSSQSFQLTHFVIEVRFRIDASTTIGENAYLVSKGAKVGNSQLDQNYALFITKNGEIGGGFEAVDGRKHYVYSDKAELADSDWHTAKLVYDGAKLTLKLDGLLVSSKIVSKNPDRWGTGPLRIGANANSADHFLVGAIDYVKVLDRTTFKKVYFNDFGPIPYS